MLHSHIIRCTLRRFVVALKSTLHEMTAIWMHFMINDGTRSKADHKLCSEEISRETAAVFLLIKLLVRHLTLAE